MVARKLGKNCCCLGGSLRLASALVMLILALHIWFWIRISVLRVWSTVTLNNCLRLVLQWFLTGSAKLPWSVLVKHVCLIVKLKTNKSRAEPTCQYRNQQNTVQIPAEMCVKTLWFKTAFKTDGAVRRCRDLIILPSLMIMWQAVQTWSVQFVYSLMSSLCHSGPQTSAVIHDCVCTMVVIIIIFIIIIFCHGTLFPGS